MIYFGMIYNSMLNLFFTSSTWYFKSATLNQSFIIPSDLQDNEYIIMIGYHWEILVQYFKFVINQKRELFFDIIGFLLEDNMKLMELTIQDENIKYLQQLPTQNFKTKIVTKKDLEDRKGAKFQNEDYDQNKELTYLEILQYVPAICLPPIRHYHPQIETETEDSIRFFKLLSKPLCNCVDCIKIYRWYLVLFITISLFYSVNKVDDFRGTFTDEKTLQLAGETFFQMYSLHMMLEFNCILQCQSEQLDSFDNNFKIQIIGFLIELRDHIYYGTRILSNVLLNYQELKIKIYFQGLQNLVNDFHNTKFVSKTQINKIEQLLNQFNLEEEKSNQQLQTTTAKKIHNFLSEINQE